MAVYTQVTPDRLDIKDTYKELMEISLGEGSAYMRAKETVQDLVDSSDLNAREKANIIASTVSSVASAITERALDAAIKIGTENRDAAYTLTKLKEDTLLVKTQAEKLLQDKGLVTEQKNKITADISMINTQKESLIANTYMDTGHKISGYSDITHTSYGIKYENIRSEQTAMYLKAAENYRANGNVNVDWTNLGSLNIDYTNHSNDGLTYFQSLVAQRNYDAFDDNMRQHVVNSSATMISTLAGSEIDLKDTTIEDLANRWVTASDYLNGGNSATNLVTSGS